MTLKESQAEYLLPGCNALETAVHLSERIGPMFRRKPLMEMWRVKEILESLNANGIRYAIIGGLAVAHHAVPRTTKDLDLVILADDVPRVHDLFREHYVKGTAVARIYDYEGTEFDVQPANLRFQQRTVRNAIDGELFGAQTKIASVRDLLLLKLWAAPERPVYAKQMQDQADIGQLLESHKDEITAADIADMCDELRKLCFTREDENKRKRAVEWLNATLEELGMGDRKYDWK